MADTHKLIPGILLTASKVALYTVPASTQTNVTSVTISNISDASADAIVTLAFVPAGAGAPDDVKYDVIHSVTLTPGDVYEFTRPTLMAAGDSIRVKANTTGVAAAQGTGLEITA